MSIRGKVEQLIKTAPELVHPENHDRVIRIFWAEDKLIRADTILRAIRQVKKDRLI